MNEMERNMPRAISPRKGKTRTDQLSIEECHNLLLNAPIGIFTATPEGRFLSVNPAMATLFGYDTPPQMIGSITSIPMQIYAEPSDRLESQRLLETHGQMLNHECQMVRRDGSRFWVSINARAVRGKDGSIAYYQGFATDITDRKQIEESLLRTQFAMDHAPGSIIWVDDQGNMVYVNDAACTSMGYSREELLRMNVFDMDPDFPRDGWEKHKEDLKRLRKMTFEGRHRTKDGRLFPVEVTTNYLEYKGRFFAFTFDRDITERKRAEEMIQRRLVALTQPMEGGTVAFEELFNLDEIQRIQDDFAAATGVAALITRPDGTPITAPSNFTCLCSDFVRRTEKGRVKCAESDATVGRFHPDGPIVQACLSAGLCNAGASITVGGRHVANWLIGQVRDGTQTEEQMRAYARDIGADESSFIRAFQEVPVMPKEKFEQIAKALFTFANQLSTTAFQNVQQARFITERKKAEEALLLTQFAMDQASDSILLIDEQGHLDYANDAACASMGYTREELLRMKVFDIDPDFPLENWEQYKQDLKRLGRMTFEGRHRTRDGRLFPVEVTTRYLEYKGRFFALGFDRDITERKRAEDTLRQKNIELDALNRLARAVTSQVSLGDACRAAVEQVMRTVGADTVVLFMREGDDLRLMASGPESGPLPVGSTPIHRVGECLCGLAVSTKRPIYVADIAQDERCTWAECRAAGLKSFAAIPLMLGDESIGILGVASATHRDFQHAARYLETAADQIAISIRHVRLLDETRAYAARLQHAIAEREVTQRALEENEKQLTTANIMLRNVLETIPVSVFWKDRDGRFLGCNTLFARDSGRERPEDVVGRKDIDLDSQGRAAHYRDEDRIVMESGQAKIGYEDIRAAPDGGLGVSLCSKIPLRNETGEIIGILGTYEDITKRKQTEEALRDRENLLKTIFQAVPLGIAVLDADKRIISANDSVVKIFGYSQDELIGRTPRLLFASDDEYRQTEETLYDNRGTMGASSIEVRLRRKDGADMWVLLSVSPLDARDARAGSVTAAIDITARKSLEGQLRQSQKMEAIGQLAGGVAHDFNNMLQAILGYAEIVMHTLGPDDRNRARVMEIHKTSERAAALTRQLLAFSRRQVLTLGPLDLNQAVDDLMKMVRRLIGENIDLKVAPCPELWTVNADRGQIEQVLMNLCLNARDAMPEGGTLSIETGNVLFDGEFCARHEWATPGRYVRLSVTDSGCGMNEETKEKIFEPFFTTKEPGKGTGLGLATVYGIMRQHDGMIQVYSEPGKGSRFSVYLPAIEQTETTIPEPEEPVSGGHETILLAEDNEQVRLLAVDVLAGAGYRVVAAADGEEALRTYRDQAGEIDLLLLDVVMPKQSGRSVYDEIRSVRSDVKCLFISGYSVDAVHTNFILDQGLSLLRKPFRNADLLRAVREVLDLSPQPEQ